MTISGVTNRKISQAPFNYSLRFEEIREKLRHFESKMGISKSVDLTIGDFGDSACAHLGQDRITLPSWCLFKYEDIPERFRISDLSDPRIVDRDFLNELATWMNDKIRGSGLSSICRPADFGILQIVIKLLRNPELYEKSKDFTIGHELAHLAHSQIEQQAHLLQIAQLSVSQGGVMAGIFLLFLAVAITPVVHLTITVGVAAVAVAITALGVGAWMNMPTPPADLSLIEQEKLADLEAVRMLGDVEGAIYYFKTQLHHNLIIRRQIHSEMQNIDAAGNNLRDCNHPKITERIQYLRQWRADANRRK